MYQFPEKIQVIHWYATFVWNWACGPTAVVRENFCLKDIKITFMERFLTAAVSKPLRERYDV